MAMEDNIKVIDPTRGYLGNESEEWRSKGQKLQDKLQDIMGKMKAGDAADPVLLAEYMAANNDVTLYSNAWANRIKSETDKGKLILSKD